MLLFDNGNERNDVYTYHKSAGEILAVLGGAGAVCKATEATLCCLGRERQRCNLLRENRNVVKCDVFNIAEVNKEHL